MQLENRKIASLVTTAAASNISYQLGALRRSVNLLAQGNKSLLQKLYSKPDNIDLQTKLKNIVAQQFPRSFTVTLAAQNGELLLDNFDGFIGDICLTDIKNFSNTGIAPPAVVHPNSDGYHIDIMTRVMINKNTPAILFVSFYAEIFSQVLLQQQIVGQRYLITNSENGKLIEVTSSGSRQHLGVNPRLTGQEQNEILASSPVQGALWNVIALPQSDTPAMLNNVISSSQLWTIAFLIMFSILSAFLAYRKRHHNTRISHDGTDADDAKLNRHKQCAQPILEILTRAGPNASLHANMHQCLAQLLKLSQSQHGMILELGAGPGRSAYTLAFLLANDMLSSSSYLSAQYSSPDKDSTIGHALYHIETTILDKDTALGNTGLPAGYPEVNTLFVRSIEFDGTILGAIVLSNWDARNKDALQDYAAIMDYCAICIQAHKHQS
ncbi:MAG TPA: hypothetical protein ENI64_00180 [Gammaproteobacteria bacterium]|nr:hypothetical protein [Gammaproteobacteria bacterium]